jgi:hypothetical protein
MWNICAKFWGGKKADPAWAGPLNFCPRISFSDIMWDFLGETRFWQDLSACTMKKMDIGAYYNKYGRLGRLVQGPARSI